LRRQLDHRELRAARAPSGRVRLRTAAAGADRRGRGMNDKIRNLFGLFVLLFALLIAFTSRWTVFDAKGLQDNPHNRRALLEQLRHPRGLILADDGTVLASNRSAGHGETKQYFRTYPQAGLFAHAVGYFFISKGDAGLEKQYDDELGGRENE